MLRRSTMLAVGAGAAVIALLGGVACSSSDSSPTPGAGGVGRGGGGGSATKDGGGGTGAAGAAGTGGAAAAGAAGVGGGSAAAAGSSGNGGAGGAAGATSGPAMITIPGGTFKMGSTTGFDDEVPVHDVTVPEFQIDATETTVSQYKQCVMAGVCPSLAENPTEFCTWNVAGRENDPANCVDWHEATGYCQWAGKRLPSEEEWEYAARGTEGRPYPWGTTDPTDDKLCWKRYNPGTKTGEGTCVVDSYPAGDTPLGLKDMAGNVREWTMSRYCPYPDTTCNELRRVTRGGSYATDDKSNVTTTIRRDMIVAQRGSDVGFRCAK
jgi:formylglycine-generating enzyme required for sulfatase activity